MAGFTTTGTPAIKLGAIFSSMPQQGKLKALICTETPGLEVRICLATKLPLLESTSVFPSTRKVSLASSRLAKHGPNTAFDIDPAVRFSRAGP